MQPLSTTALEAHYSRVTAEGGERLIKDYRFGPYRAALVYFAGAPCLIIRPVHRNERAWNVCIPRSEMHRYLRPDGNPEPEAFWKAAEWVGDMGREVTPKEITRVVDILVQTWPDFFNVMPDAALRPREPIMVAQVHRNGALEREVEL